MPSLELLSWGDRALTAQDPDDCAREQRPAVPCLHDVTLKGHPVAIRHLILERTCSQFADSPFNLIPVTQFGVTGMTNSLEFVSLDPRPTCIILWHKVALDLEYRLTGGALAGIPPGQRDRNFLSPLSP